ncbi:uncharacterized protein V1516DRAFT_630329, partial [Lipomyces oligophaga]|uniref:uncharacterized protein n=1 Tax=Lipomyces oligophaga TaxID=45792 RepID=UPI0034CFEE27
MGTSANKPEHQQYSSSFGNDILSNSPDPNSSAAQLEQNMSLPSIETSFTGSLVNSDVSGAGSISSLNALVRQDSSSHMDQFFSSPPVSPAHSPVMQDNLDCDEPDVSSLDSPRQRDHGNLTGISNLDMQEDDDYDEVVDSSPLLKKSEIARPLISKLTPISENKPARTRSNRVSIDPTETVIANRVKEVKVTDSAVKSFALRKQINGTQQLPRSANKPPPTASKLTLKEQSALIDKLQKENFGLQIKVYYMTQELDKRSEDGMRDLRNENIELKSMCAKYKLDMRNQQSRFNELENKLRAAELTKAKAANSQVLAAVAEADVERQEEFKGLQQELESCLNIIDELRYAVDESEAKIREYDLREQEYIAELDHPKHLENSNKILEEEIAKLHEFLAKEEQAREQAQNEVHELRADLLRVRRSGSKLGDRDSTGEILKLRKEIRDLRREVGNKAVQADAELMEKERLYYELDDLKRSAQRSSTASSSRRSLTQVDSEEYDKVISELRGKISEVKYIARERKTQVDVLNKENADLQEIVDGLQSQIQTFGEEKSGLENEIDRLVRENGELEAEIVTWQEDYESLSTEADAELARLNELLSEKDSEFERMNSEIDSCTKLLSMFERDADALKKENAQYRQELAEQKLLVERLRGNLEEQSGDYESRMRESQSSNIKEVKEYKKHLKEAESFIKDLRAKLAEYDNSSKQMKGEFKRQIEDYKKSLEELTKQLETIANERESQKQDQSAWKLKEQEYETLLISLRKEISELQ